MDDELSEEEDEEVEELDELDGEELSEEDELSRLLLEDKEERPEHEDPIKENVTKTSIWEKLLWNRGVICSSS